MRWNGKNFRPAGLGRKPQVNPQPRSISKPFNYKDLKLVGQFFGGLGQEEGPAPTPSVTPSITPTPSMTPTPSPTISPTPTPTPSSTPPLLCDFDYEYVAEVSISPTGASQNQNVILSGSTDLDSPTFTWSLTSFNDASGSTVSSYTGNPLTEGYFTTTGSSNVTLTAVGEDPFGNTVTATTSTFEVLPSTVLILASSNNGTSTQRSYDSVNWTGGTLPGNTNNEWASMATNGEGLVVAANREPNDTEQFAYTYDGVNWTGDTYSGSTNFRMSNIVWSEYLRKFVTSATDNAIGSFILQSSTGFNWGTFTTPSNDVCTIISDEKNDLLIIQDEASKGVYSSPDGVTWTLRFTAGNRIFASIHNKTLGLDIMVEESTHQVRISSDGINYTNPAQLVNIGASQTTSIAYRRSDGRTIVCSYTTNAGYYTDDGSTWTQFTMPAANVIALTYAERTGEWVAIDRDGDVFTSTTGISGWTSQTKANTADYRFVGEFIFRD